MNFSRPFLATAIGSFPYDTAEKALDLIFASIPEAPVWPQLPKNGLLEQMEIQYSEGLPRVKIDNEKHRMYFDTAGDYSEEFADFYEQYMAGEETGDYSAMAVTPRYSTGLHALLARLTAAGTKNPFVKVQVTGPCSFALTITDENKRAIFYNEEFRDIIVKAIAMKARWQIQQFKPYAEQIICFIDEPILSAFGSSTYISVKREDVIACINEVVNAVHAEGALAGVHCCGNTDWSILVDAEVDIINFDAYGFGKTVAIYPAAMKQHIGRGGLLAWGIVPTSPAIRENNAESLASIYESLVDNLAGATGIDRKKIIEASILTPSCGTGSMDIADAEKVFATLKDTSASLRAKYGY